MARNKKKTAERQRKQRQQKKQKRRDKRHKRHPSPSMNFATSFDPALSSLPLAVSPELLADYGDGNVQAILQTAWETENLLKEPEFDQLTIDPVEVAGTFMQTAETLGVSSDEGFASERMGDVFEQMTEKLLTPELCAEIATAAEAVRARARAEKRQKLLKQAAALQFIMEVEFMAEYRHNIGFIQKLIRDNLDAGFTLLGFMLENEETEEKQGEPAGALTSTENMAEREARIMEKLAKNQALDRYMTRHVDELNEAGRHALFDGELELPLYTEDELAMAMERVFGDQNNPASDKMPDESNLVQTTAEVELAGEEQSTATMNTDDDFSDAEQNLPDGWMQRLVAYVEEIITPTRQAEMVTTLEAWLATPENQESPWREYVFHRAKLLAEEEFDSELDFLVAAFWGELQQYRAGDDADKETAETQPTIDVAPTASA